MRQNNMIELEKQKTISLIMCPGEYRYNQNHDDKGRFAPGNGGGQEYKKYKYSSDVDEGQPSISYDNNVKSDEQKRAVDAYTAGHGIDNYDNINSYLNGKKTFSDDEQKQLEKTIESIDSAIQGETDSNMMVYRGIAIDADKISIGDSIANKGFTSTSASKDVADDFANYYNGVTISIKVPKGTKALFVGYHTSGDFDEAEVLFGRGAIIVITEKKGSEIIGELRYA